MWVLFQSTPSARRATAGTAAHGPRSHNFNPRPPRGGRRLLELDGRDGLGISIHALREEGDAADEAPEYNEDIFQSTPSARRATVYARHPESYPRISIHALREEGDA